jgi:hypothetical protein
VRINVAALDDAAKPKGARLIEECGRLLELAAERVRSVTALVEKSIG